ncbi:MAG: prepilin-type N-terminal cleavage/methylation domain-containing protein [Verrucomicrobia bacterium]|nr:prepilin-type N-terminal cleavage/methylation domain-containing protein [Verrucomicrobiota bacterium]
MRKTRQRAAGFTLMELLLAMGVSAVALAAINALFFSAIRLRETALDAVDNALPMEQALTVVRRDLQDVMLSPSTNRVMSGDFRVGDIGSIGFSESVNIELYTTTGTLRDHEAWAEVQRVTYRLRESNDRSSAGKELVRGVTRNLLATITPMPDEQVLLTNVKMLEIECYDGFQWRNTWDSTQNDTNLPVAVRMRILPSVPPANPEPIELLVPIQVQVTANETETEETP